MIIEQKEKIYIKLNHIAEYILKETKVDIRIDTLLRDRELSELRHLFYVLATEHVKANTTLLSKFLNQNRTIVSYAKNKWNEHLYKKLSGLFVNYQPNYENTKWKIKIDYKSVSHEVVERESAKKSLFINYVIANVNNETITELLKQKEETVKYIAEYKIKPALRMLKSNVTNEDLINKQKLTRKM